VALQNLKTRGLASGNPSAAHNGVLQLTLILEIGLSVVGISLLRLFYAVPWLGQI